MNESAVIIVGAGPAGLGTAIALQEVGVSPVVVLEKSEIGASFARWPAETRFISPSFPARGYGVRDLNSISDALDPGHRWSEHPSGLEYAEYLQEVARLHRISVITGQEVVRIEQRPDGMFALFTRGEPWVARCVVWAGGEFQFPRRPSIPGAEHGIVSMRLSSYELLSGDEWIVIGGFESGVDVACYLVERGAQVVMLDPHRWWEVESLDPSCALSPVSRARIARALQTGRLRAIPRRAVAIRTVPEGFAVDLDHGESLGTKQPPLLATGFRGSLDLIAHLLEFRPDGSPQLTDDDESTRTRGLYLAGPMVRRAGEKLCFIYKFRVRFAVIAESISERLQEGSDHA